MVAFSGRLFLLLCFLSAISPSRAGLFDYFLPNRQPPTASTGLQLPAIPYELSEPDEKFIRDGAKLLGSPLSGLDMCHQRVVLVLRNSCATLNAEQLGKLAVMLLNCQSAAEDRPQFECTDAMQLSQCTQAMDADTWNAYHLVTNRAKAVCTAVRQEQFRGLTEMTVGRLMEAARGQVEAVERMAESQAQLAGATQQALEAVGETNGRLMEQQRELVRVSDEHRSSIESNLADLLHEKNLIAAGQLEVATMIAALKAKIDDGLTTLDHQSRQSHANHAELLADLDALHANALQISARLEHAMDFALSQAEVAAVQFDEAQGKLHDIRGTVYEVADVVARMRTELQQHLRWLTERVGGQEDFVRKLQLAVEYVGFVLGGMLVLVFVGAGGFSRAVFLVGAMAGFAVNWTEWRQVELGHVTLAIGAVIAVNFICRHVPLPTSLGSAMSLKEEGADQSPNSTILSSSKRSATINQHDITEDLNRTAVKTQSSRLLNHTYSSNTTNTSANNNNNNNYEDDDDDTDSVTSYQRSQPNHRAPYRTPATDRLLDADRYERNSTRSRSGTPFSLSGAETRTRCTATTNKGERCRLAAQPDDIRCRMHCRI